jgi:hypothetical protein
VGIPIVEISLLSKERWRKGRGGSRATTRGIVVSNDHRNGAQTADEALYRANASGSNRVSSSESLA